MVSHSVVWSVVMMRLWWCGEKWASCGDCGNDISEFAQKFLDYFNRVKFQT